MAGETQELVNGEVLDFPWDDLETCETCGKRSIMPFFDSECSWCRLRERKET